MCTLISYLFLCLIEFSIEIKKYTKIIKFVKDFNMSIIIKPLLFDNNNIIVIILPSL